MRSPWIRAIGASLACAYSVACSAVPADALDPGTSDAGATTGFAGSEADPAPESSMGPSTESSTSWEMPDAGAMDPPHDDSACDVVLGGVGALSMHGVTLEDNWPAPEACGGSGGDGEDATVSWRAPSAARYRFAVGGEDFTPRLALFSDCTGETMIACTQADGGEPSMVEIDLEADHVVMVLIDDAMPGDGQQYALSVTQVVAPGLKKPGP
jgi:hypothetical protein